MLCAYLTPFQLLENEAGKLYQTDIQTALDVGAFTYTFTRSNWPPYDREKGEYTGPLAVDEVEAPPETHAALEQINGVIRITPETMLAGMPAKASTKTGDKLADVVTHITGITQLDFIRANKEAYE
jgi:hypothetical protein